jgi:hypothetical protein
VDLHAEHPTPPLRGGQVFSERAFRGLKPHGWGNTTAARSAHRAALRSSPTPRAASLGLPADYFDCLLRFNGGEGDIAEELYGQVLSAEDALNATAEYECEQYLPGYFVFGSDLGGELFVMPQHSPDRRCPVYRVPAIGMGEQHLIELAESFHAFVAQLITGGAG